MSWILNDLQKSIRENKDRLEGLASVSPFQAYAELSRIALEVGEKHNVRLQINFTSSGQAAEVDKYGSRNLSIIVDNSRKKFKHLKREDVLAKATQLFPQANIQPAFGYEGREGFRITMGKERIDVLAATIHLWCEITDETRMLLDWLFKEEYQILLENT